MAVILTRMSDRSRSAATCVASAVRPAKGSAARAGTRLLDAAETPAEHVRQDGPRQEHAGERRRHQDQGCGSCQLPRCRLDIGRFRVRARGQPRQLDREYLPDGVGRGQNEPGCKRSEAGLGLVAGEQKNERHVPSECDLDENPLMPCRIPKRNAPSGSDGSGLVGRSCRATIGTPTRSVPPDAIATAAIAPLTPAVAYRASAATTRSVFWSGKRKLHSLGWPRARAT